MLRVLSNLESFYVDHEIAIVTVSDLQGTVNPLLLQKAIETVVMMHPLLSSEIHQTDDGYTFTKRTEFNDKLTVIGEVDKEKRKQIILSELNKPVANNSLIRCILMLEERVGIIKSQSISLLTSTHHAVSDGVSSVALHEQIWKVYAEISSNKSPEITPFPVMPAIENLIPNHFTEAELEDYIERYEQITKNHQPFTLKAVDQDDAAVEIGYVRKKFTLKQTKTILENCEKHNVSVHGAICAANLLALRDLFGVEGYLDLSCRSTVDVRSQLEPAIANNAMFSAAVGCVHCEKVSPDMSLWILGDAISNTIANYIASGDVFKSMLTYKDARLKSHFPSSIGVINVGFVKLSQPNYKLKLLAINFIPRIPLPVLSACVITSGDKLTITYPYAKPFYSGNVIKKIVERAANYLLTSN